MTEQGEGPSLSNSHFKQQTHRRILAARLARVLLLARPRKDEGAGKAGRRRAPASPCATEMHTGWTTGSPDRPAFPARMVLTVSFVLSPGSDALLPPSPCGWLTRAPGWAATSPQALTHRPRASGPHDFSVRARLRMSLRELACARARSHAKTLSASCRRRKAIAHGRSRPAMPVTPDAVASIAARPAVRDDRDPPLVSGQGVLLVRQIRISVKWNICDDAA